MEKILFVCLGNICRSPSAHEVMNHLVESRGVSHCIEIDSAGTAAYHAGELPDARMRLHAARRGYNLTHRSRPVRMDDFYYFDRIIAMDDRNVEDLKQLAPDVDSLRKIVRLTDYCSTHTIDHVPDPYYGGEQGFEQVLDILEDGCEGLLADLLSKRAN
ncbi:MAG: low molecular weight protein-tyrosine-phosphatase [Phocaeicola sp.]